MPMTNAPSRIAACAVRLTEVIAREFPDLDPPGSYFVLAILQNAHTMAWESELRKRMTPPGPQHEPEVRKPR